MNFIYTYDFRTNLNTLLTNIQDNLSSVGVRQHSVNATDTATGKYFLVPLQKMTAGTFRWNFEATIYVLHQDIQ